MKKIEKMEYFRKLAFEYEKKASWAEDHKKEIEFRGKSEKYEMQAFDIEKEINGGKNMAPEKIKELKNLFNSIEMFDEAEEAEEIINDRDFIPQEVDYLQDLRRYAEQAERTTFGDEHKKYRYRRETLTKIIEIIYLFA